MKLSEHQTASFVKLLLIGNSGAGKTGALTSLVADGYKLRIIDMDNGLDALVNHIRLECPDKLDNVEYETIRDRYKAGATGPALAGPPKAVVQAFKLIEKWTDDTNPAEWGPDYILVIDSLTMLGRAALAWARAMNPTIKEKRQWYQAAQDLLMDVGATVSSEEFRTNVIIISHVDIAEQKDGSIKGLVSTIGKAIGPKFPAFFNTLLLSETSGIGTSVRRRIKTVPTAMLDLKNPAPMRIKAEYPLETALSTIFKELKGDTHAPD